ncbi:MAG: hypothetical protein ACK4NH_15240, partial [Gemmobacter sp.]
MTRGSDRLRQMVVLTTVALLASGCSRVAELMPWKKDAPEPAMAQPEALPAPGTVMAPAVPAGARTAEALDTTTAAQKAAAMAPVTAAPSASLGKVVVSLGDVTTPGFWL